MKRIFVTILVLAACISGFSQKALERKAKKHFVRFEFVAAACAYEKILENHPDDVAARERLANCYRILNYPASKLAANKRLMPSQSIFIAGREEQMP